ncbi:MAG: four helix bundle protein [Candidatus Staskawiczbacteria bacterium]|nr:four helix bundle protein [Candidatus Staskawiczbacteria bacterium]
MTQNTFHNQNNYSSNPPKLLPVLEKIKSAYLFWYQHYLIIPKTHRYSLGEKIDKFFVETLEAIITASFLSQNEKLPYVRLAIRKIDTLKIFLMLLWETKSFDNKKYIALSLKLDEIGKNLGGWCGQILKQNSLKK